MWPRKSAPLIQYAKKSSSEAAEQEFVRSRLSQITLWSAFWSLLLLGSIAFGSADSYSDVLVQLAAKAKLINMDGTSEAGQTQGQAASKTIPSQAKISRFCIFGVDDLKLRPSAARGKNQPRRIDANENGDCWIDKPGQMA